MKQTFKQDKGTAGLTILLSIIVMLFMIGLIVMIFSLMSGEIADQDIVYTRTGANAVVGEDITPTDVGNVSTAMYVTYFTPLRSTQCEIVACYNDTTAGILIESGNYTEISECVLANLTSEFTDKKWQVNYTYTYLADINNIAGSINDTTSAIAGVTDWFDIFIVISAMVVLILLTVIIITAIRSSGMIAGGQSGANQVGTA